MPSERYHQQNQRYIPGRHLGAIIWAQIINTNAILKPLNLEPMLWQEEHPTILTLHFYGYTCPRCTTRLQEIKKTRGSPSLRAHLIVALGGQAIHDLTSFPRQSIPISQTHSKAWTSFPAVIGSRTLPFCESLSARNLAKINGYALCAAGQ